MGHAKTLENLLEQLANVVPMLAVGMQETRHYMSRDQMQSFLDDIFIARIGMRVLVEHYIATHTAFRSTEVLDDDSFAGVIHTRMSPKKIIQKCTDLAQETCGLTYG